MKTRAGDDTALSKKEIVEYYEKELNALQLKLEQQTRETLKSEQALQSVLQSKFWRITKPLRGIKMFSSRKPQKAVRQTPKQSLALPQLSGMVSFVIPVYNGGEQLEELLECINRQTQLAQKEIVIIDSGSTDGSIETAKKHGAILLQIPNAEFTHAHARNLGAQTAKGKYLVFLTQDALPQGYDWARRLLEPLAQGVAVAASGMQVPRPNADLFSKISMDAHNAWIGFTNGDRITQPHLADSALQKRINAHLDDVNCAVLRDVMLKYPHRMNFLEDLDLGLRLQEAGLPIALMGSVKIVHSHNRTLMYGAKRGYVDTIALNKLMPRFMENPGNAAQTLALLVNGYRQLTGVCAALHEVGPNNNIVEWQSRVQKQCENIPRICVTDVSLQQPQSGDDAFDKLVTTLCNMYESCPKAANNMYNRIICYLKESLFHYINANCPAITEQLLQQAIDAFKKFYAVRVGVELASYTIFNDDNKELTQLAHSLAGGV